VVVAAVRNSWHGPCIMAGDRAEILSYPESVEEEQVPGLGIGFARLCWKGYYAKFGFSYLRTDRARRALKQAVWVPPKGHRAWKPDQDVEPTQ
jgi:hypothetical protein